MKKEDTNFKESKGKYMEGFVGRKGKGGNTIILTSKTKSNKKLFLKVDMVVCDCNPSAQQ